MDQDGTLRVPLRVVLVAGVIVTLGVVALIVRDPGSGPNFSPGSGQERSKLTKPAKAFDRDAPNVVVVMTDDQALDTMKAVPKTTRLLGGDGVTFSNAIASFPLCCPSRASFLTGAYAHNHRVLDNRPPKGGVGRLDHDQTLPVWLSRAGYETGFVGKYLNGYGTKSQGGGRFIPPGWGYWFALTQVSKLGTEDYEVNKNGKTVKFAHRPANHSTDVMADEAVKFIGRRAPRRRPFFLWVATHAPHFEKALGRSGKRNPTPAPRHFGRFDDERLPRDPSFNEPDVSDKPSFVRERERLKPRRLGHLRKIYVSQLESLLAVDDLVERVVAALRQSGELDDTLIVFTSDHGFLRGQHRFARGKAEIYEPSVRVPLLVRGPGFPAGRSVGNVVANVDVAATILRLTGARASTPIDGVPLRRALTKAGRDRAVLIEIANRKSDTAGVRTGRYVYAEREDEDDELYDLRRDPHQLENAVDDSRYAKVRRRLSRLVARLAGCAGSDCR